MQGRTDSSIAFDTFARPHVLSNSDTRAKLDIGWYSSRRLLQKRKRGWMGIEPTASRFDDPPTALKAAEPTRRPDTPLVDCAG